MTDMTLAPNNLVPIDVSEHLDVDDTGIPDAPIFTLRLSVTPRIRNLDIVEWFMPFAEHFNFRTLRHFSDHEDSTAVEVHYFATTPPDPALGFQADLFTAQENAFGRMLECIRATLEFARDKPHGRQQSPMSGYSMLTDYLVIKSIGETSYHQLSIENVGEFFGRESCRYVAGGKPSGGMIEGRLVEVSGTTSSLLIDCHTPWCKRVRVHLESNKGEQKDCPDFEQLLTRLVPMKDILLNLSSQDSRFMISEPQLLRSLDLVRQQQLAA